jgi:hypothetical protein
LNSIEVPVTNLRLSLQVDTWLATNASSSSAKVGLIEFTDQFDTSLLVKSLSVGLQGKAAVAEVRGSNNQLAKEFGLGAQPQYPIILALCSENGKLAGLKYPGNMKKRAEIEAWVDTNFLGRNRMKTCKNLRNAEADEAKRRHKLTLSVASMNKEQLLKKRVKQLREIAEDLDIKTDSLLEKDDFVRAILDIGESIKAKNDRNDRLERKTQEIRSNKKSHRGEKQEEL